MNIPNVIKVKKHFNDRYLTTPSKHLSLVFSMDPSTPEENAASIAGLQAYANSIRAFDADTAACVDILVADLAAQ